MSIQSAIKVLSSTPPPAKTPGEISAMASAILNGEKPKQMVTALKDIHARTVVLESQLGLPVSGFTLNPTVAAGRLVAVEVE